MNNKKKILAIFSIALFFSCVTAKKKQLNSSELILKFIDSYTIPNKKVFNQTTIGGLSGIDYDSKNDIFYLISDDRGKYGSSRFYKAKINFSKTGIKDIEILDVLFIQDSLGKQFSVSDTSSLLDWIDPEDIRFNPIKQYLAWSDEGERIVNKDNIVLKDPSVNMMKLNGGYLKKIKIPSILKMNSNEKGSRRNGTFEGLTFSNNYKSLFFSIEDPLYEDGNVATIDSGGWVRIFEYNLESGKHIAQYAYLLEPVAEQSINTKKIENNGISAILSVGERQLFVVERSYSSGNGNVIKLFLCDLNAASNINGFLSLGNDANSYKAVPKKLILNTNELNFTVDNIEGISYGPVLPNGSKTIIFVTDDNFSLNQKTQILMFELCEN